MGLWLLCSAPHLISVLDFFIAMVAPRLDGGGVCRIAAFRPFLREPAACMYRHARVERATRHEILQS